jgi:putative transposase
MRTITLMAHTFYSLNVHCIFSTKERVPMLSSEVRERLWPYLGGIAKQNGVKPACIGGAADHVHLLLSLPTTIATAKIIQLIKAGSSAWIHDTFRDLHNFAWQDGYGAFSVSVSHMSETVDYIKNQAEHHRTRTFQEEYLAVLRKHNLQFEDKYLWT